MNDNRTRYIIISALIQGILLGIYAVIQTGPLMCMPLTVIFIVPFVFWLSQEHWGRRLFSLLSGLTLVLLIFWLYRLWSLYSSNGNFYVVPSQKSDLIRVSMAVFLLIPFFQCRIAAWSWHFPYTEIFFQLCRNLFLLFQSSIVIAVFWGLLVTAGLLFDIVGLPGVPYLLFNPVTAVPLSSLIIAISISVAIKHPGIDSLGRWILSVLAWLLPFFSILSVMFILCLPFSGLKTLWSTGQASTLMLLLQFGTIILANAAWLDGTKQAFRHKGINLLAQVSLLCLPIYTGLCMYSVGIRVAQYGLSTDRIQAMFLVTVTGIWGLGYAAAVLFGKWPGSIGKVNIACVLFMAVLVTVMNSPLLDPYKLAAYNQAQRLESGAIKPEDFDYLYARFNLGRYGNEVLEALSKSDSQIIRDGISDAFSVTPQEYAKYIISNIPPVKMRHEIIRGAKVYPEDRTLSDKQADYFVNEWEKRSSLLRDVQDSDDMRFVFVRAVISDAENLILFTEKGGTVYTLDPEIKASGIIHSVIDLASINEKLESIEPRFMNLKTGDKVLEITRY